MKRVCKQCGKEFELSEGEIRFYEKKGLELPKRCQQCREQKRAIVLSVLWQPLRWCFCFSFLFWENILRQTFFDSAPQTPQSAEFEGAYETASERTYEFRKHRYLTEHFEKHGDEFPYDTEEAYLQGANNVINNPDALHKLEKEDGDDVYFVEDTNEFVVVSTDGYIRTYFIADIDYYNRQ